MAAAAVFAVFLIAVALSVPIGVSMVAGTFAPVMLSDYGGSVAQIINNTFSGANSTPILAVPLFILGGVIMAEGGVSKRLFDFFAYFMGKFTGGIPCAVIITCLFYGAVSGSGPATAAAVGSMCIPFMVSLGYDKEWSAGLIAVAGGLGVIIPPSIPFVLYSLATGVSTGDLFLGGILPGTLVALFLILYSIFYCRKNGENSELIGRKLSELRMRGFFRVFLESLPALLCPIIVLGSIYAGFASPTEAACISVFYALIVSLFIYRSIGIKDILPMLKTAVKTYAGLAFVLAFATAFGRVLSLTRATGAITGFITSYFGSAAGLMSALVLLFLLLGTVMDTGPAIIILAPIVLPSAAALGVDPVHLGVVMVCCLSIGLSTPPFGLNLFVVSGIAGTGPIMTAKKALPLMLVFAAALLIITYIPWFSTALI